MPEVTVKHNVKDATPPQRETLPSGVYHAKVVSVRPGLTRFKPELQCITVEYSVVKTAEGSVVNDEPDNKYAGRSIFQDYVLEKGTREYDNQREAFRMQQLMAATGCPHKPLEGGMISFNTDHLLTKGVKITVTQKAGKVKPGPNGQVDPKEPLPIFNNVDRVDSEAVIDEKDLV